MVDIRDADNAADAAAIRGLWLEYLTWGNDELEARHGFRLPVLEAVEQGFAHIEDFSPPDGRLLLACDQDSAVAIACLRRIGPATAEVKRMYVRPAYRRGGLGRAMLERLIDAATAAGYARIRLDSSGFMAAAHAMYRSYGFVDIEPYAESEIPDEYKRFWVFMERVLP